ncbi:hypothetical protein FOA43_003171 [Brettanomyces nanus]|uniref:Dopey N-terminal domain-containing protein n=1 Tax=Eeniella nana TaxID=13502 RepID=A0A875S7Y0_EENNA|nr:uncharacterized protein FOA43_003171 [Brettanomyces nanus]QPG75809.1 hypothetical protein FOA43_003171 [Brettanomyces nanus]
MTSSSSSSHLKGSSFLRSISPLPLFLGRGAETRNDSKKLTSKEKKYVGNIERALAAFESVDEWADYISFLGKLQRALQSNPDPHANNWIPHEFDVSKTLAQCISPKLPSGVHLKTIEVYRTIFDILGQDQLSVQVQLWIPGVLPLMSYASISVKPELIGLYTQYLTNIDPKFLRTIFKPLLLSLLPALDDTTSEFFDSVLTLIDSFRTKVHDDIHFWQCIFLCIITSPDKRTGAMEFCFKRLPDFNTANDCKDREETLKQLSQEARDCVMPESGLLIRAFCQGLRDDNLFVQRGFFDLLLSKLQLRSSTLQCLANEEDIELLILSASETVLRRDMSLNRRLWNWILGPENAATTLTTPVTVESSATTVTSMSQYFDKYGFKYFSRAIFSLINGTATSEPVYKQNIKVCRIAVAVMDRWEIGQLIVPKILVPIVKAAKLVLDTRPLKEFDELLKSANVFFDGIETISIWSDVYRLVKNGDVDLVMFILKNFHIEDEDMIVTHIPLLGLAIMCLYPQEENKQWLELLKNTLEFIPQRALLPLDHSDRKYLDDTSRYNDPSLADDILHHLDKYYSRANSSEEVDNESDSTPERPFNAADLSALYLGLIGNITCRLLRQKRANDFYNFCELLGQLLETIPSGELIWQNPTLLNALQRIDPKSLLDSEIPIAFGAAIMFKHIARGLSKLEMSRLLKVVIGLLWKCLIHPSGRYQVEAVRKLWDLEISVDPHYIEAGISSLFLLSDESTRIRAFNILWTQSASFNETDSILSRPLYIILDGLNSDNNVFSVLIAKWLQNTLISGTLNRIFKICCSGLLSHHEFIFSSKFANNENDDFALFAYELTILYKLLTILPHEILPVFNSELCVIDNDSEMGIISANEWNISTYKSLALAILKQFISIDPPKGVEEFQLFCSCVKLSLDLMGLLMDGSEQDFDATLSMLTEVCQRKIPGDEDHLLGACYLSTIVRLMKISSKNQLKVALFEIPKGSKKSSRFLEFVSSGITNSVTSMEFHSWMVLIQETSQYYSELVFGITTGLTECICNKMEELFALNKRYFTDLGEDTVTDVDDSICELIGGLQSLLIRSHKYLSYLLSGSLAYGNTDSSDNSGSQVPGFFGSMIQGVFQVEAPTDKGEIHRRKILLLKALKKSVVTVYGVWLWSDENSKVRAEITNSANEAMAPGLATGEMLDNEKPPFLSFTRSVKYNASKLKFRSKKLLECVYSIEPMETLETLIRCYVARKGGKDRYSAFKIIHILDGSKLQTTLHYMINSLVSRVSITSLEPEKRSLLLTNLSASNISHFLVEYVKTLSSDAMEDSWEDLLRLMKEASSGSSSYRMIYPDILEFAALVGSRLSQTNFGDQKKVKREIVDSFTKILNIALSAKFLQQYDDGINSTSSVDLLTAVGLKEGESGQLESEPSVKLRSGKIVVRDDLSYALVVAIPLIPIIVNDVDKRTTCFTSIANSVAIPLAKHSISELTSPAVIALFKVMGEVKEMSSLRIWKNLCYDILNDSDFFSLDVRNHKEWNGIFKSWITHEPEKLGELIMKLSAYLGTNAAANIFNWSDSESNAGANDLKRIAYLIMVCPKDEFINSDPALQERLIELFASSNNTSLKPYIFLVIRMMIVKFSQIHLSTFWPTIYTELERVFHNLLEKLLELKFDDDVLGIDHSKIDLSVFDNNLILQACKLLDYLLVLGLEEFQLSEWLFVNDNSDVAYGREDGCSAILSLIDRISSMKNLKMVEMKSSISITSSVLDSKTKRPLLYMVKQVSRIFELKPFFDKLSVYKYESDSEMKQVDWAAIEEDLLTDIFD